MVTAWLRTRSNCSALSAKIKVVARTPAGERAIHKTVNSGGRFGANPLRQETGLGDALAIDRVEILWPTTGKTQVLRGLAMDAAYHIEEGAGTPAVLDLKPVLFKKSGGHAHHHDHH